MDYIPEIPIGFELLHELNGHTSYITRMSWSPMGHQLITASVDCTARIWESSLGLSSRTLIGHKMPIHDVILGLDGKVIVTASSDHSLRVWDSSSGNTIWILKGHSDLVLSLSKTSNEKFIISTSLDKTIRVWNLETGQQVLNLRANDQSIYSIAAFQNDQFVIAGSIDRTLTIWNLKDQEAVLTLRGHSSSVWDVAIHPQEKIVASASPDKTIRLWDLESKTLFRILEGHTGYVIGVSFSPDGSMLVSKSLDGTVRLWSSETWEMLSILPEEYPVVEPSRPLFNPRDINILATLGNGGKSARIWKLDYDQIFSSVPKTLTVNYTTAKIALVGESGVGKSALGFRIATGEFKHTESTHGQQFWVINELGVSRRDGTECEAVLWDFAGQPDYRIVHSLFLDDVDLAVILFDASNQQER